MLELICVLAEMIWSCQLVTMSRLKGKNVTQVIGRVTGRVQNICSKTELNIHNQNIIYLLYINCTRVFFPGINAAT